MRIKRLELCGFKSFVDPTALEFAPGISGIVGPNGCGKSNLVDALRWVLGEQSAKQLRGDSMEDVIFNGTAGGRGPAGMAEVSLLLDNERGGPQGEEASEVWRQLREVAEIQVTRRYFRSGESEYLINGRTCRLKDVTELFLGTGVGTKAYAMIKQGQVDQIVNAKPEDLRRFIEEAAGTTLYRDRRLAAERKLERTRDNLARVSDILREIDQQIAFFRRLAKRAEQARQLQGELRRFELQLGRRQYDRLSSEIGAVEGRRIALREEETTIADRLAVLDREREAARAALSEAEDDRSARQEALYALRGARSRAETRLEMIAREEAEAAEQKRRLGADSEQSDARLGELREEMARREEILEALRTENEAGGRDLAARAADVEAAEAAAADLAERLEALKTRIVEELRAEAEIRNRLRDAVRQSEEKQARRERLAGEIGGLEEESHAASQTAERLNGARQSVDGRLAETRAELAQVHQTVARLRTEKAALENAALAAQAALAETQSRLLAAEEVERGYERYHEGVRAVMSRHGDNPNGIVNLVARIIDAPREFEKPVAAVLNEALQYVVVRRPEDACEAIRELKEGGAGRATFVPLEPRALETAGVSHGGADTHTRLLDLVRVEEGFGALAETLLGDAVLVSTLEDGLALWRRNGQHRTFVTPEGEVVRPSGVVTGGSAGPYEELLLAQRNEIRRLVSDVERLRRELTAAESLRTARAAELSSAERRAASLEEAARASTIEQVSLGKDGERARETVARTAAALERARREAAALEVEIAALAEESVGAERTIGEVATRRAGAEDQRTAVDTALRERRAALTLANAAATELKVALAQAREKEQALRDGLAAMTRQLREIDARVAGLRAEAEALGRRSIERLAETEALRLLVAEKAAEDEQRTREFEASRAEAERLRAVIEEAEGQLSRWRARFDAAREERAQQDLAHAEATMRRENLCANLRERYQVEAGEVALEEGLEEEALAARVAELQQKVDRIDRSSVGAEAAGELGAQEERRTFLVTQKEDLERSIADLQKTIANLNRQSRDRFVETFAAVNEKFQEAFPRLFRGGRARLVLTDESNLMETGVDIQVQPPGMNLRTLSLLSGGQKALTAVSLIFSLFLCRPSPFCVLDEVDAPLDDANIDRFNQMVVEMGARSQFLIITHNQRTMEVADTLYGVTMEEPGVSKIVSVRFQDAA